MPLDDLLPRLSRAEGRRLPLPRLVPRAAVAAVLRDGPAHVELLLIERAQRSGDPWSGHLAFPGGRAGRDEDAPTTARRETWEEVGLELSQPVSWLSDVLAGPPAGRKPLLITPLVYIAPSAQSLTLAPAEVASAHWVPLPDLGHPTQRPRRRFGAMPFGLPYVQVQEHVLWGLTLGMIDDLLRRLG